MDMEIEMGTTSASPASDARGSLPRVLDAISALGCSRAWARAAGRHILVGMFGDEAFARLTPMAAGAYGLAFRSAEPTTRWAPMLLVDDLAEVVLHALVGVDALAI
jgi:hypothetical protein